MKDAIIIHGYSDESEYRDEALPAASNAHWFPWIQRQLLLKGISTQTPEMPGFYEPHYEDWKNMLQRFSPHEETMLVGHSLGGGFLVRWLSETNTKVGKVVLVAPWLDPKQSVIDERFFKFEIDEHLVSKTAGLVIMFSRDDDPEILRSVELLRSKLKGAVFQEFVDKGHFVLGSMNTEVFPELLANLV